MAETSGIGVVPRLVAEFFVIVVGVLVAFGFEGMRQNAEEREILDEYLQDIAFETIGAGYTFERMLSNELPARVAALDRVIGALESGGSVDDPEAFLLDLERSGEASRIWFVADRYDALRASGTLRLVRDERVADALSTYFSAAAFMNELVERHQGDYPKVVAELVPVGVDDGPLAGYAARFEVTADVGSPEEDPGEAVARVLERRFELLPLARGERYTAVARWNATLRVQAERRFLLEALEPWWPEGTELRPSPFVNTREVPVEGDPR